jgi:hypothetical protein
MAIQDTRFQQYAGQEIAGGIRPNIPLSALEEGMTVEKFLALPAIDGAICKIGYQEFLTAPAFTNPLEEYISKATMEYGAGGETVWTLDGTPNKAYAGRCIPKENVVGVSQIDATNFAVNTEVTIKDMEMRLASLGANEFGSWVASKMAMMAKRVASVKYASWIQKISDVVDGTRSIASTSKSGAVAGGDVVNVTYAPNIIGYAGGIIDTAKVIPDVVPKVAQPIINATDGLDIIYQVEQAIDDMNFESTEYNPMGVNNFLTSRPILVMEAKVVGAIDRGLKAQPATNGNIVLKTVREQIADAGATLCEIDSFASLPTNAAYANHRLGAVLLDQRALWEIVQTPISVESIRCPTDRSTNYNMQGVSILKIQRGYPSAAFLFATE